MIESAPRLALTSVLVRMLIEAGSAPELSSVARSLALDWLKLPEITAVPLGIGSMIVGLVTSLPPWSMVLVMLAA